MASRTKGKEAARERAAAMRAEQQRAERRRRVLLGAGAVGVVLLVVVGLVVAKLAGVGSSDGTTTTSGSATSALPASVATAVTSVPAATLDKVGVADVQTVPHAIKAPALTSGGKPKVLYVGAEYCPFCAAERWPVVVALSRFGTWSGLGGAQSATNDAFPETQTVSFHGATYSSPYLGFTGVETNTSKPTSSGQGYTRLDDLSAEDQKTFDAYNKPPYVASSAGAIPFLDLGGAFASSGASFSPDLLKGKSREQIATALSDPSSDIAKAVGGNANVLTAALCTLTGQQPTNVCTASGVKAAAAKLGAK